jgi:SAM-dependent methyltransferase
VAVHADVRALPFGDAEFAAVVSNSTLDHFDSAADITDSLREIGRVLRPGGTLVVTLDNPWNPVVALGKALPRHSLNRAWLRLGRASARVGLLPYHVGATLSLPRLRRLLRSLGFDVVESDTIMHAPRAIAVIAASLVTRRASPLADDRFLRALGACEHLARWPTRAVTGHFVAVRALRRHAS